MSDLSVVFFTSKQITKIYKYNKVETKIIPNNSDKIKKNIFGFLGDLVLVTVTKN